MKYSVAIQDISSITLSAAIVLGFVLLFLLGFFGFKILDFIDGCMISEAKNNQK